MDSNGFEWVDDKNSEKGCFLEVDVGYPKNVFNLHGDLWFLPERKKIGKCNQFVCDFHGKKTILFT